MNENEYLAKMINEQLEAGLPIVLISIVSLQGSTPRHSGTQFDPFIVSAFLKLPDVKLITIQALSPSGINSGQYKAKTEGARG